jgi:hypothetical protein
MRRLALALIAVLTVVAGLGVHTFAPESFVSDATGDVLYAVLIVLLVAFVVPRAPWWASGVVALTWCVGVELLQLTTLPAEWGSAFRPLSLVFGTTFSPWDLLWYTAGVALAAGTDGIVRRRSESDVSS